jgi:predicted O-methyltransferase YrrM
MLRTVDDVGTMRTDYDPLTWLRTRPWERAELPEDVQSVPTMISPGERALLYVLARDYWSGAGALVDGGCFLGGSTLAFAEGLLHRPTCPRRTVIHTYDLFLVDETAHTMYAPLLRGLRLGDSTRAIFDELLGARLALVEVHSGDVRGYKWTAEPIEVLFIDIAKGWTINDHISREFFPALIPGRSVLIQQDYIHEWTPWLHITMELLGDAFTFAGTLPYASAIFVPQRSLNVDEIPKDLRRELSTADQLELFDRSAKRFSGAERAVVECSGVFLLSELGRRAEAVERLEHVAVSYEDPRLEAILPAVRGHLAT